MTASPVSSPLLALDPAVHGSCSRHHPLRRPRRGPRKLRRALVRVVVAVDATVRGVRVGNRACGTLNPERLGACDERCQAE